TQRSRIARRTPTSFMTRITRRSSSRSCAKTQAKNREGRSSQGVSARARYCRDPAAGRAPSARARCFAQHSAVSLRRACPSERSVVRTPLLPGTRWARGRLLRLSRSAPQAQVSGHRTLGHVQEALPGRAVFAGHPPNYDHSAVYLQDTHLIMITLQRAEQVLTFSNVDIPRQACRKKASSSWPRGSSHRSRGTSSRHCGETTIEIGRAHV